MQINKPLQKVGTLARVCTHLEGFACGLKAHAANTCCPHHINTLTGAGIIVNTYHMLHTEYHYTKPTDITIASSHSLTLALPTHSVGVHFTTFGKAALTRPGN